MLAGKSTDIIPVTPHWWGLYKFQAAGIVSGYEDEEKAWTLSGNKLAEVDVNFYEAFMPDMFHLTTGRASNYDNKKYAEAYELKQRAAKLDSKNAIDEYIDFLWRDKQHIIDGGEFEHVKIISQAYGEEVLIAVNEGLNTGCYFDPHGYVGFEEGLIGLVEKPENTGYYLSKIMDMTLERVKALSELGCHAYISSETYCSSDLMSPISYHDIIFPLHKKFFEEISKLGIIPIGYFTGNIIPMLDDIKQLGLGGLMIEESKKGFILDVGEISKKLEGSCALFGNLDSVDVLQKGTPDDVRKETLRQLKAVGGARFIMSNGCPISFDTPAENIKMLINTVREYNNRS